MNNMKLINEKWIDDKIFDIQISSLKLSKQEHLSGQDMIALATLTGAEEMLKLVKEQLQSPKEIVSKAYAAGWLTRDGGSDDTIEDWPADIKIMEQYLKDNNYE